MSREYDVAPEPPRDPWGGRSPRQLTPPPAGGTPPWPHSQQTLDYASPNLDHPRPNGGRARVTIALALVIVGLSVVSLGLEAWDYSQFNAAEAGTLTDEQVNRLVLVASVWIGFYALAVLGFFIAFFMWLYRAVKNVRITSGDSRHGPGVSIVLWFIPIANLVMPWLILRDLWQRTVKTSAPTVGIFWLVWLGSGLVDSMGSSMYNRALDAEDWDMARTSILITSAATVASIASYLLLVHIIRSIQSVQQPSEMTG